ncbi:MAG: hypothetical protein RLY93_02755 [Sumerlaeia bacterium]
MISKSDSAPRKQASFFQILLIVVAILFTTFAVRVGIAQSPALEQDPLLHAADIFNASLSDQPEGLYRRQGILFVLVRVPRGDIRSDRQWRARTLLRSRQIMVREATLSHDTRTHSVHFPQDLRDLGVRSLASLSCPNNFTPEPSFEFSRTRVLQDGAKDGVYLFTVALSETEFDNQLRAVMEARDASATPGQWLDCSRKGWQIVTAAIADDRELGPEILHAALAAGLIEDLLLETSLQYPASYRQDALGPSPTPPSYSEIYRNLHAVEAILAQSSPSPNPSRALEALEILPAYPPALAALALAELRENHPLRSAAAALRLPTAKLASAGDTRRDILVRALDDMSDRSPQTRALLEEFLHLQDQLAQASAVSSSDRSLETAPAIPLVLQTSGHCFFPPAEPSSNPSADFLAARQSFERGEPLSVISAHLDDAIAAHPHHAESWNYLGRVAELQDGPLLAVCFYTQARLLEPRASVFRENLARVYETLGYPELARGMKASLLLIAP